MPSIETTIANIEAKVRRLMEENVSLREQVAAREASIARLQDNINQNNSLINQLKEENNKLISSRNSTQKGCNPEEIKHRIDQLIDTIDESLALLDTPEK